MAKALTETKTEIALRMLESRLSTLYLKYSRKLLKLSRRIDWDDYLQELRLKVWCRAELCDASDEDGIRGWVMTVAHNVYVRFAGQHYFKCRNIKRESHSRVHELQVLSDASLIAEVREEASHAEAALNAIPIKLSRAVRMRYYAEMDQSQIAKTLGITPVAARCLCRRGLDRIRELVV